jgi:hypothetical protein
MAVDEFGGLAPRSGGGYTLAPASRDLRRMEIGATGVTAPDHADDEWRELRRQLDGEDVRDAARELLEPGEALRELGEVWVAFGDTGPVSEWQPMELEPSPWLQRAWAFVTRTTLRKIVFFPLLAPLLLYAVIESIGSPDIIDRWVGGRTCEGPRDSLARRFQHALSSLGGNADHVVVSDRRLLLTRRRLFAAAPEFTPIWSLPLAGIARVRHRPRGLVRRRVELSFADGSRIVLALPVLRSPHPRRLVAALTPGGPH